MIFLVSSPPNVVHSLSMTYPLERESARTSDRGFWREFLSVAVFAALIVIPIRLFLAEPFVVNGASMDPNFTTKDYLIIDKISYRLSSPDRGDVIVLKYPQNPSTFFIKRIIGLPSETISIQGSQVTISGAEHSESFVLDEPYLTHVGDDTFTITLTDDEYFVMGDNRPSSSDSRVWGPLPKENVVGRAFVRLLPVAEAGLYPADDTHY